MPDIVTSKTFVDGEKGITATKLNQIISGAVIQPSFVTSKPSSPTLDPTDQMLEVKGAGTYATITGQQLIDSVSASVTQNITPTITAVRMRSYNAASNPTFEIDQKLCGSSSNTSGSGIDRWAVWTTGTMAVARQQLSVVGNVVPVPGTNFGITHKLFRITLTTQQASLGANDDLICLQAVDGPRFRELINDVHSLSLLVQSSVSGLKFGVSILSPDNTRSLTKLCTLSAAGFNLIQLPNLPVVSGGNFSIDPGNVGYVILITLAAGASLTSPANDTWQNGKFYGAIGQDNFASKPVNSTFDIAFIQHEPGSQCTTPIDCSFSQNLTDCQRYYCKSYNYTVKPGTVDQSGAIIVPPLAVVNWGAVWNYTVFPQWMAKSPTVVGYSPATGAANSVRDLANGADRTISSVQTPGENAFGGFAITGQATTGNVYYQYHYTADTGW